MRINRDEARNNSGNSLENNPQISRRARQRAERAERRSKNGSGASSAAPAPTATSTESEAAVVNLSSESTATASATGTQLSEQTSTVETKGRNKVNFKGARVINFAVQGGRPGQGRVAIFASGEGPDAVTPKTTKSETTESNSTTTKTLSTTA